MRVDNHFFFPLPSITIVIKITANMGVCSSVLPLLRDDIIQLLDRLVEVSIDEALAFIDEKLASPECAKDKVLRRQLREKQVILLKTFVPPKDPPALVRQNAETNITVVDEKV